MPIAVLLSGGVDSSVALLSLLEAGERDLTAFFLKVWLEEETLGFADCPWEDDLASARAVAEALGVPLEVVPLQREYRERIVTYTIDELRAGRTPSPDVLCNRHIKLGAFLEAVGGGYGTVASGHYARVVERPPPAEASGQAERWLATAADPVKDQTYFLSQLTAAQLARCRFPLGDLSKAEVREIADRHGLATARRPDSQGLCFLGEIPFDAFVRAHLGERPGPIRDADTGRTLGEHRGHWFYTVGQRKGLGLSGGPWFVTGKSVEDDTIWVIHGARLAATAPDRFLVPAPHWITRPPAAGAGDRPEATALRVKLRHGPASVGCRAAPAPGRGEGALAVTLERPDPGLAPGQFAVFYDGELCLGGGAMEVAP